MYDIDQDIIDNIDNINNDNAFSDESSLITNMINYS